MLPPWQPLLGPLACLPVRSLAAAQVFAAGDAACVACAGWPSGSILCMLLPFYWVMMGVHISSRTRSEVLKYLVARKCSMYSVGRRQLCIHSGC